MNKLTKIEEKLLDNYFITHNIENIDEAQFVNALGNVVPLWRLEQLVDITAFTQEPIPAYINYIKNLSY